MSSGFSSGISGLLAGEVVAAAVRRCLAPVVTSAMASWVEKDIIAPGSKASTL